MTIVLGANQYGKAENRLVRVYRDTPRHEIRDLNVSSSLRGDFRDAHITGDQAAILPTDTQKNTVFAFAKEKGVRSIEEFALTLGDHFIGQTPKATGARIEIEEYFWDRISVDGAPPPWRSWEDVVNLPPKSRTRIAWLPDDRTGSWMYHCHILEHQEAGMMAHFDVVR